MKIIYCWVEKHINFLYKDFNFSAKYKFKFYKESNILECRMREDFPSDFYEKGKSVKLISYVIGDNGAGKTTLMNFLKDILPYEGGISVLNEEDVLKVIYALEDENEQIYIYSTLKDIEIEKDQEISIVNSQNNRVHKLESNYKNFLCAEEMKSTQVVYHTNIFDRNEYNLHNPRSGISDISFNGLILKDNDQNTIGRRMSSELRVYLDADMKRQLNFICSGPIDSIEGKIGFSIPDELNLFFVDDSIMMHEIYNDLSYESTEIPKYDDLFTYKMSDVSFINEPDLKDFRYITARLCKDIIDKYKGTYSINERDVAIRFINRLNLGILCSYIRILIPDTVGQGTTKKYTDIISHMYKFMASINSESSLEYLQYFMVFYNDNIFNYANELNSFVNNYFGKSIFKNIFDRYVFRIKKGETLIQEFYSLFRKTAFIYDYMVFRWNGLSSGEVNFLSLYSRVYYLKSDIEYEKFNSFIFLFDEADLSFHPKWQQRYVSNIVNFLNELFSDKEIQIIIASHSPIMLSDAIKGSVVFLSEKGENSEMENTFGANIYDLYRDGMFLENGIYGVIGKFASEKIKNVIELLEKWEKNGSSDDVKDEFKKKGRNVKKLISCIGEPVIKNILMEQFKNIETLCLEKTDRINNILQQIKNLSSEEIQELTKKMKG